MRLGIFLVKRNGPTKFAIRGKVEPLKLFLFVVQTIINHAEYCDNNYHNTCYS